jgi:hypothetical protein
MPGFIYDRSFFQEFQDKPIRPTGAAWVEPAYSSLFFDDFNTYSAAFSTSVGGFVTTDTVAAGAGKVIFVVNAAAGAPVAGHGGWIRGTVSDNAGGAEEIGHQLVWRPDRCGNGLLVFQTRINLPAITALNISTGLTSATNYANPATAMSISGTTVLVTTAVNGACWLYDTRGTDPDIYLGASVDNNVDSCASTVTAAQALTLPTALGKSIVLRIEMDALGNSFFYSGGEDVPGGAFGLNFATNGRQAAGGSTLKSTLLTPYLGIGNSAVGANKSVDADYFMVACAR